MPRLFLAFTSAQGYKIHYIQFGKIFDMYKQFDICHILCSCHILYVKNLTKLYIMYLLSLCKYEGQK